ncbi:Fe-S cluster assembly protein SufD [Methylophaga sp. OBS1]|uniref:Fe-S cluster assembly protein SufD n=1 Tax=Methylophaga sp. OBS1 TaxID=2991933 RepID=UPI002255DC13|nr:Fe-S cluster assembly protein SufD [Methylophaga sp. OBS1]MCX4190950.1 Fe-S cluster assembly protein SufD [Methylophaga sp. OBS1]MCX4192104.1 Fe-S cluster assembly protein SufD [Methylophaga sp. OBS1]
MKQLTEITTPFGEVASAKTLPGTELGWLQQLRDKARAQFERHGLPAKKVEDWKYTSLWSLSQEGFSHDANAVSLDKTELAHVAALEDAYRFVIIDGRFSVELSELEDLEEGLSIKPLAEGLDNAQSMLGEQIDLEKPGLNAINTMLMQDGLVLQVNAGKTISKPVELLVISTAENQKLASHLRNLVQVEADAEVTLLEHYVSLADTEGFTNVVTEVKLDEKATLNHFKLQHESLAHYHIATLASKQAAGSNWHTNNISLGGKLARNDIHSQLLGEEAHVTLDGLYLVTGDQHVDNHTRIDHAVPNTTSDEVYKGVLDGNSHAVFNGKVNVHKDAQKTDSSQSNKNLLLSRSCEIDTKPELEIYADDVKCAHGSTVGQIDEQHLFFLRARGLDETAARSLLTYAFAVDVLQRIKSAPMRQALSNVIEKRLPKGA